MDETQFLETWDIQKSFPAWYFVFTVIHCYHLKFAKAAKFQSVCLPQLESCLKKQ